MEDDRRPSGPGDPSSPASPGQYDDHAESPGPGATTHDAAPDSGAGGQQRSAPASEPRRAGFGDDGTAREPGTAPGPESQAPGTTGWRPASPSSPYTIPTAASQARSTDDAPWQSQPADDPFTAAAGGYPYTREPSSPAPEDPLDGTTSTGDAPGYGGAEPSGSPHYGGDPSPTGGSAYGSTSTYDETPSYSDAEPSGYPQYSGDPSTGGYTYGSTSSVYSDIPDHGDAAATATPGTYTADTPEPPRGGDPFTAAAGGYRSAYEQPSPSPDAPLHGNAAASSDRDSAYSDTPRYGDSEPGGYPQYGGDPFPTGGYAYGSTSTYDESPSYGDSELSGYPHYGSGGYAYGSASAYSDTPRYGDSEPGGYPQYGGDPFPTGGYAYGSTSTYSESPSYSDSEPSGHPHYGSGYPYGHDQQAAAPYGQDSANGDAPGDGYGAPPVPPSFDPAYTGGYPDPAEEPRRSRKGLVIGIVSTLVVLALVGGGVSWYVLTMPEPEDTVTAYAQAWNSQDYAAMADLAEGGDPTAVFTQLDENLGVEAVQVSTGQVEEGDDTAAVPFDATLDLSSAGEWSYSGELPLVHTDGEWKVDFGPAAVHPELGDGQTLVRTNQWGERGNVLAADGSRLDDGSASGSVQMIVGEVGTASEENLSDLGPAYEIGDPVGVSGVQKSYEERLAGKAATAVRVAETGTEPQDVSEDAPTVATLGGSDGKDVTLSLDPQVQAAASQAIVGQSKPTAIAALRPSTGEVLAAANVPGGFNRALEGQYPAGSIFKIISYHALLNSGMGTGAQMSCPKTVDVGGRTYKNAGDAAYGAQSVTEAFATSCNTALVQEVANRLDGASLLESAERFGFNTGFNSGLPVFKPSLPQPDSVSLLTASSIGQGQVLTSPLHLASLPAAVADGSWRAPLLVSTPAPGDRPEPRPLDNVQALRDMTRAVVTEGTAKDVGFTGEVHGKSGTAEYGTAEGDEELPAHGWFVGYEGDIAFAVVVEDGESGSGAAAPLAKAFLDAL